MIPENTENQKKKNNQKRLQNSLNRVGKENPSSSIDTQPPTSTPKLLELNSERKKLFAEAFEFSPNELSNTPPNPENTTYGMSLLSRMVRDFYSVPSDNDGLLYDIEDCKKLIKSLWDLGNLICPDLLLECRKFLLASGEKIKNSPNQLSKDARLNQSKAFTLYAVKKIYGTLIHLPIKKDTSQDELTSLLGDSITSEVSDIESLDLKAILEWIEERVKGFNNPLNVKNYPLVPSPFLDTNLAKTSSSIIMRLFYDCCISKNTTIKNINGLLSSFNSYKCGDIHLHFEGFGDISLGEDTYKVLSVLITYWYCHKDYTKCIKVSGEDILKILNQNNYVERLDENTTIRRNKQYNLNELANHIKTLKRINVFSESITYTGSKNPYRLNETPLIIFEDIGYYPEFYVTFKMGGWFKLFDGALPNLTQFDYIHKEAYRSNGLKSYFLLWLPNGLGTRQSGDFKIETILNHLGAEKLLEARNEANSRKRSYLQVSIYLKINAVINSIIEMNEDPYEITYKASPPNWVTDESIRKPRGWFEQWLNLVLIIKHPDSIFPDKQDREYKRQKLKPKSHKKYVIKDLIEAVDKYKDHPKVSIRNLTTIALRKKHPWLQRRLDPSHNLYGKISPSDIKTCLDFIKVWVK